MTNVIEGNAYLFIEIACGNIMAKPFTQINHNPDTVVKSKKCLIQQTWGLVAKNQIITLKGILDSGSVFIASSAKSEQNLKQSLKDECWNECLLFEAIHPFSNCNGRTGRVINYFTWIIKYYWINLFSIIQIYYRQ
jgi:hypothetical protein